MIQLVLHFYGFVILIEKRIHFYEPLWQFAIFCVYNLRQYSNLKHIKKKKMTLTDFWYFYIKTITIIYYGLY